MTAVGTLPWPIWRLFSQPSVRRPLPWLLAANSVSLKPFRGASVASAGKLVGHDEAAHQESEMAMLKSAIGVVVSMRVRSTRLMFEVGCCSARERESCAGDL